MPESPSTYCRKCGYNLAGLVEPRCPECGRGFDPGDPRTFHVRSWEYRFRRRIRRVVMAAAGLLLGLVLVAGGGIGWLYWGWRAEQPALKALLQGSGWIYVGPVGPDWVGRLLPIRWDWMLLRATDVTLFGSDYSEKFTVLTSRGGVYGTGQAELTDAELAHLESLRYLGSIDLHSRRITDAGLRYLRKLGHLRSLALGGRQESLLVQDLPDRPAPIGWRSAITGTGLVYLGNLPHLEHLLLSDSLVTDDALADLAGMQSLNLLDLRNTRVTDAGLAHLRCLPNLRRLCLDQTNVSDAGIPILLGMQLHAVSLKATKVSPEGFAQLKASIPKVTGP